MIFKEGCALNGTFKMNLIHLAKHLHLDLSQQVPPKEHPCLKVLLRVRQRRNCLKCPALVLDTLICLKMNGTR